MAPSRLMVWPVVAFLKTTNGTDSAPKLPNSFVLVLMVCSTSEETLEEAAIPPRPASSDVSCSLMSANGLAEVNSAAPCDKLDALIQATGIHTNFTFL